MIKIVRCLVRRARLFITSAEFDNSIPRTSTGSMPLRLPLVHVLAVFDQGIMLSQDVSQSIPRSNV